MTAKSEDAGTEFALRSIITTCTVRAFGELAQAIPAGERSAADCQTLLGALMLAEAMGVPAEALAHVETAESIGRELALVNSVDALCARLRLLEGCPAQLPCPACGAQMKSPTSMIWLLCQTCGARLRLLIYFAGVDGEPWMPRYALALEQAQAVRAGAQS